VYTTLLETQLPEKRKKQKRLNFFWKKVLNNLTVRDAHNVPCKAAIADTHLSDDTHIPAFVSVSAVLQEIIGNRFLSRHASRILGRSLKDTISPSRAISVLLETVVEHRTQPVLAVWSNIRA